VQRRMMTEWRDHRSGAWQNPTAIMDMQEMTTRAGDTISRNEYL